MLDEIKKQIDDIKQTLDTLPKNTKFNVNKYKEAVNNNINEFSSLNVKVKDEISRRKKIINDKLSENTKLESDNNNLINIVKQIPIFNKYNSSFEKARFDRIFYNFYEKDNKSFDNIINNIKMLIEDFRVVGIELKLDDFKYSPSVYKFMKCFYENTNENDNLKMLFEKIYWKTPDFISHLELNFKYLYYRNSKLFDKRLLLKQEEISKNFNGNILEEYHNKKKEYDNNYNRDIFLIVSDFKNKDKNIADYEIIKINELLSEYISDCNIEDEKFKDNVLILEKLYYTILEYLKYLKYTDLINNLKKLYSDKANYKGVFNKKIKEIKKEEKKLFRLNGKLFKLESKNKNVEDLFLKINEILKNLKTLYDELEMTKLNENLFKVQDSDSVLSLLEIANSYYVYQAKFFKSSEEGLDISKINQKINKLLRFTISPYNHLINNLKINGQFDVKEIISNIYNLSDIKITKEMFEDESSLEKIKSDIERLLVFYYISLSDISIEDIKFLCSLKEESA